MRVAKVSRGDRIGVAVQTGAGIKAVFGEATLSDLDALISSGAGLAKAAEAARKAG